MALSNKGVVIQIINSTSVRSLWQKIGEVIPEENMK